MRHMAFRSSFRSLLFSACIVGTVCAAQVSFAQGSDSGANEDYIDFFSTNIEMEQEVEEVEITPEEQAELETQVRREAFDAALQGLLPLRPEEIRELLEHFDRTQQSVETPVYPNPKPEVAVQTIPLDPGTKPAVINVSHGHVTTLNILDITGAPWAIEDITWAGDFEVIQATNSEGSHFVRIAPQSDFAHGNMSIKLLTLKTPIIMTLATNRDVVHYRFDAIIPDYGPLAQAPLIENNNGLTAGAEPLVTSVLQGIVPPDAERLDVHGVDARTSAYRDGDRTFVRTPLTLLSPSWSSSVASADGMRVYTIQNTPVLLLSDNGKMVRAQLSVRENLYDE